jgi:cytidyltransferase-like protein
MIHLALHAMYPAPDFEHKLCEPGLLATRLKTLPRPLVFTNGCFEIVHRGHVTYLAQARALGASLIVGVNSDASVKRLNKGNAVGKPGHLVRPRYAAGFDSCVQAGCLGKRRGLESERYRGGEGGFRLGRKGVFASFHLRKVNDCTACKNSWGVTSP